MKHAGPYIRIVCEGSKTEPNYFNGWLRANGFKLANPALKARDHSPLGVAREARKLYKEALQLRIPSDRIHIWAVFDRDDHAGIPEAYELLRGSPVRIAFSCISFEFWVLLHYERTSQQFRNWEEIIEYIHRKHDANYQKSNDHYYRLKGNIEQAIENAKWLLENHWKYDDRPVWDRNPYTDVHEVLLSLRDIQF